MHLSTWDSQRWRDSELLLFMEGSGVLENEKLNKIATWKVEYFKYVYMVNKYL